MCSCVPAWPLCASRLERAGKRLIGESWAVRILPHSGAWRATSLWGRTSVLVLCPRLGSTGQWACPSRRGKTWFTQSSLQFTPLLINLLTLTITSAQFTLLLYKKIALKLKIIAAYYCHICFVHLRAEQIINLRFKIGVYSLMPLENLFRFLYTLVRPFGENVAPNVTPKEKVFKYILKFL